MLFRANILFVSLAVLIALPARGSDADKALDAFFAREWDYQMEQSPLWASSLGDLRWNARIDDVSLAAIQRRQQHDRNALAELRAMPVAGLSTRSLENREIFLDRLQGAVEGQRFPY